MSTKATKTEDTEPEINEQELEIAEQAAKKEDANCYTFAFSTPFEFEGESYDKLSFDFGALTAADSLAIEAELTAIGTPAIVPEFSGDYLIRMAMRACTDRTSKNLKIGIDTFMALPMAAYVKIRGKARSFLLRAGS